MMALFFPTPNPHSLPDCVTQAGAFRNRKSVCLPASYFLMWALFPARNPHSAIENPQSLYHQPASYFMMRALFFPATSARILFFPGPQSAFRNRKSAISLPSARILFSDAGIIFPGPVSHILQMALN